MESLGEAWDAAVATLGGTPDPTVVAALEQAHEGRAYHGLAHVLGVVADAGWLAGRTGLDRLASARVTLAACTHDVVYTGRAGEDERASADWAAAALTHLGVWETQVEKVRELVLATIDHDSDDHETSVLNDADLAILGSVPADYAGYVRAVRTEYANASDEEWRTGRSAVLTTLLERPTLFRTDPARERWEEQARTNMAAELDELRASPPQ